MYCDIINVNLLLPQLIYNTNRNCHTTATKMTTTTNIFNNNKNKAEERYERPEVV